MCSTSWHRGAPPPGGRRRVLNFPSTAAMSSLLQAFYTAGLKSGKLRVATPLDQQLAKVLVGFALLELDTPGHRDAATHLDHALSLILALPDAAQWASHPTWKNFFLGQQLVVPPRSMLFDGEPISPSLVALLAGMGFQDAVVNQKSALVMPPRGSGAGCPSRALLEACAQVLRDALLALVSRAAAAVAAEESREDVCDCIDLLACAPSGSGVVPLNWKAAEAHARPGARLLRALGWAPAPGAEAAASVLSTWAPAHAEARVAPAAFREAALEQLRESLLPTRPLPPWPPARDYLLPVLDLAAPQGAPGLPPQPLSPTGRLCILQPFAGPCSLLAIANCIMLTPSHRLSDAARRDLAQAASPRAAGAGGAGTHEVRLSYLMSLIEELTAVEFAEQARLDAFLLRVGLLAAGAAAERARRAAGMRARLAYLLRDVCRPPSSAAASIGVSLEDLEFDGTFPAHHASVRLFHVCGVPLLHGWVPSPGSAMARLLARVRVSHAKALQLCAGEGGWGGLAEGDLGVLGKWVEAEALTPTGLEKVCGSVAEGTFACLYRSGQCVILVARARSARGVRARLLLPHSNLTPLALLFLLPLPLPSFFAVTRVGTCLYSLATLPSELKGRACWLRYDAEGERVSARPCAADFTEA